MDEYFDEATDRNSILIGKYNKIPSYALWRDIDIERQKLDERIKWWSNYSESKNKLAKSTAEYWLKLLKEKNK